MTEKRKFDEVGLTKRFENFKVKSSEEVKSLSSRTARHFTKTTTTSVVSSVQIASPRGTPTPPPIQANMNRSASGSSVKSEQAPDSWDLDQQRGNKMWTPMIPTGTDLNPDPSWADMAQEEEDRARNMKSYKEFVCMERSRKLGRVINIVAGLELHTGVFNLNEQKRIVYFVNKLQQKGINGKLKEMTYSAPPKIMRGKGRVTMQFGCIYRYAKQNGKPPGIMQNVEGEAMPNLFKEVIKRLLKWGVLPMTCVPDSCIVNIYEPGDCIPPHVDSLDFLRPFCTISFLSECNILFGDTLKITGAGEFAGPFSIPLPVGSVLVLNGNGADEAKHCIPAVPTKRISLTFRKMVRSKWPVGFALDPDLQTVKPLSYELNSAHDEKAQNQNESQHLFAGPYNANLPAERWRRSSQSASPEERRHRWSRSRIPTEGRHRWSRSRSPPERQRRHRWSRSRSPAERRRRWSRSRSPGPRRESRSRSPSPRWHISRSRNSRRQYKNLRRSYRSPVRRWRRSPSRSSRRQYRSPLHERLRNQAEVIRSSVKASSVERVVMTSSMD